MLRHPSIDPSFLEIEFPRSGPAIPSRAGETSVKLFTASFSVVVTKLPLSGCCGVSAPGREFSSSLSPEIVKGVFSRCDFIPATVFYQPLTVPTTYFLVFHLHGELSPLTRLVFDSDFPDGKQF